MRDLDKAVFARAHEEVDVAGATQVVVFGKTRIGYRAAATGVRGANGGENIGRPARTADRDKEVTFAGVELDLLGKHILIAEIIAEARQRRRIVERHRPQTAVLGEIDCEMAGNSCTATVSNKDDLVVAIMGLVRHPAYPLAAFLEWNGLSVPISDFGPALQPLKRSKIPIELFAQRVIHFIKHVAISLLEQAGEALDQSRLVDRAAMADDLNLKCADNIADKANPMDRSASRHQGRRHCQKGVTGANGIHDILGNSGDGMGKPAPFIGHTAVLALGDNNL